MAHILLEIFAKEEEKSWSISWTLENGYNSNHIGRQVELKSDVESNCETRAVTTSSIWMYCEQLFICIVLYCWVCPIHGFERLTSKIQSMLCSVRSTTRIDETNNCREEGGNIVNEFKVCIRWDVDPLTRIQANFFDLAEAEADC